MRVIENNYKGPAERTVLCVHCYSKLAITDADLHGTGFTGKHAKCPCCSRTFQVLTEAEVAQAYYTK